MRFRAKYARFENWNDNIVLTEDTYESKLGGGMVSDSANDDNQMAEPPMPQSNDTFGLPSNIDFMSDAGDMKPPY